MNIAVAAGKNIKNYVDEDALTACVFGGFKYLPTVYLKEFLGEAQNIRGVRLKNAISISDNLPQFHFWQAQPPLEWKGPSCEPDLILKWDDLVIVEESKWTSPKSGSGYSEGTVAPDEITNNTESKYLVDQLTREFHVAKRLSDDERKKYAVLFLTNHAIFPKAEVQQSIDSLDAPLREIAEKTIFWINWKSAAKIFNEIKDDSYEQPPNRLIAEDILNALKKLENIDLPFEGFDYLKNIEVPFDWFKLFPSNLFYIHLTYHFRTIAESATQLAPKKIAKRKSYIFYRGGKNG